jgi:hypothetical protein|uniref:Uncharacterized protein n=1 Tax=Zea mays TaxID=4577 RepID=A0A804U6M5_MAIZE
MAFSLVLGIEKVSKTLNLKTDNSSQPNDVQGFSRQRLLSAPYPYPRLAQLSFTNEAVFFIYFSSLLERFKKTLLEICLAKQLATAYRTDKCMENVRKIIIFSFIPHHFNIGARFKELRKKTEGNI